MELVGDTKKMATGAERRFIIERPVKILLLESAFADAENLINALRESELLHELHWVETRSHFLSSLHDFAPDVILCDNIGREFGPLDALRIARKYKSDIPFIVVTNSSSEEFAASAIRAGADDYILKDNLVRLSTSIINLFSKADAQREKRLTLSLHEKLKLVYEKIEENNKAIRDSINYAKLIQEAMLPDQGILEQFVQRSFIIYKPKDIVSGDFYWFARKKEKLIIVVADCTGHGVPGAFMSVVGNGLLNEIVNLNGHTEPSRILRHLNLGVRRALKQDANSTRCDGMDVAICTIDKESKTLQFAGANRHIVFIRKGEQMEVVKGDKFGIGGLHAGSTPEFRSYEKSYLPTDTVYMFTDGYADQFGGARGKRMMTKNLFNILQRSLSFGLEEQEEVLLYWLKKWQRNLEQTDDILLLGFEM